MNMFTFYFGHGYFEFCCGCLTMTSALLWWWTDRWNISAGAARPNPQGSFKYGQITVTDFYLIVNRPAELIDGRWHTTLNGISYLTPSTPLKLAQQFKIPGVYKVDFPNKMMNRPPKVDTSLINGTFKGFMEIIFQNNATTVQSYHMDGYAFFVVGWASSLIALFMSNLNFDTWNFERVNRNLIIWTVGWTSECGQRIVEAHTTNGMELLGVRYRCSFLLDVVLTCLVMKFPVKRFVILKV